MGWTGDSLSKYKFYEKTIVAGTGYGDANNLVNCGAALAELKGAVAGTSNDPAKAGYIIAEDDIRFKINGTSSDFDEIFLKVAIDGYIFELARLELDIHKIYFRKDFGTSPADVDIRIFVVG